MITQAQIDAVWNRQEVKASRNEIRSILEAFERLNTSLNTPPLEVGPDQKVFVRNTDNGSEDEFASLKEAREFLQGQCEDRDWEPDYIDDYVTVIVGREVSIETSKVYSVKFS